MPPADPATAPPSADPAPAPLDMRRIVAKTVVGIALAVAGLAGLAYAFREPMADLSRGFMDALGPFGLFLGFALPDGITLPIPPDTFLALGLLGGAPFHEIVLFASLGSLTGGTIAFGIGRLLGRTRRFRAFMERRGAEVEELVRRYGGFALGLAALTPIPYSMACYASAAAGMDFRRFILISLLRIPRIAGVLYLIQLGVMPDLT